MSDLFASGSAPSSEGYDASAIEVLEGLEPVRRRPGMYIGGTDARALHHLAAEVIDNSMDEAVAGHASRIEVTLEQGNRLTVLRNQQELLVEIKLTDRGTAGQVVSETTDPSFRFPTTFVEARGRYLVVNSQFDARSAGTPPALPFTVSVVRKH